MKHEVLVQMKKRMIDFPFRRKFFKACLCALIISSIIPIWRATTSYEGTNSLFLSLSVSLKSPQDGIAVLYYDIGEGFSEKHIASLSVRGDGQIHQYLFEIPNKTIYNLRWDPPLSTPEVISIHKIEILDGYRRLAKHLNLRQLEPLHQIQAFNLSEDKAEFRIQQGANDPQVKIHLESPIILEKFYSFIKYSGWVFMEFMGLFLAVCLLIYVWFRQRDKVIASIIMITFTFFCWQCWALYDDTEYLFLDVTMSSSVDSTAQVYYNLGQGLNEKLSRRMRTANEENLRKYRFKIPNKTIYDLRFDPLMTAGKVRIGEMKVTDAFENLLRDIPLHQLVPLHQIKSINTRADSIEIVVSENANDPQIALPMKEALNFEGKLPFPMRQWLLAIMEELGLLVLVAFLLVWGYRKKWGNLFLEGLESPFFQEKMPLLYLGSAFGLILAMAFISGLDVHPDEWNGHIKAAVYYIDNWLPPAIDDPRIVNSISVFGISYLFHIDPFYFLAVKATKILSGIVLDFYLRLRLVNALLFFLLVLVVVTQMKRLKWIVLFLVISPQVWYVSSYFNNDAFPLFIAMILATQVVDPESFLNRYLSSPTIGDRSGGVILVGILMGFLFCSKLNYRVFIAFLIFVGLWRALFEASVPQKILVLKKWIFLFIVALLVYLPIYGYDQYVNDFKKNEKIINAINRYAAPQFKISKVQKDFSSTLPGLRLKDKGISLQKMFLHSSDWRDLSFKSFFGLYGYMDLVSDEYYYQVVTYVLGIFFVLVLYYMAFSLPVRDVIFILFVLLFAGLVVGQSLYHSWINDYQPQGRYLFPILPMFMVGLARLPNSFRTRIIPLFSLVFFILGVWSFLLTGLKMIPKIN
jgi:hypothetical protein